MHFPGRGGALLSAPNFASGAGAHRFGEYNCQWLEGEGFKVQGLTAHAHSVAFSGPKLRLRGSAHHLEQKWASNTERAGRAAHFETPKNALQTPPATQRPKSRPRRTAQLVTTGSLVGFRPPKGQRKAPVSPHPTTLNKLTERHSTGGVGGGVRRTPSPFPRLLCLFWSPYWLTASGPGEPRALDEELLSKVPVAHPMDCL